MKALLSILFLAGLTAAGLYFASPEGGRRSSDSDMLQLADFAYQEKRYKDAFEWYQTAANQGLSKGQLRLSQMYQLGEGVDKDDSQAAQWMLLAANQGLPQAEFEYAEMLETGQGVDRGDKKVVLNWYKRSAEQGYAKAMLQLAKMYFGGVGIEQNSYEALTWALKAENKNLTGAKDFREQIMAQIKNTAEKGIVFAQYMMGKIYNDGQGIDKNPEQAEYWLRKAANQGYSDAQFSLGEVLIKNGNDREALHWVRSAANQGHVHAGHLLAPLHDAQNSKDSFSKESWRWLYHGMKINEPQVLYNLAVSLSRGKLGLPQTDFNYDKWLENAANGNVKAAQNNLGVYLILNTEDAKQSVRWLKRAAEKDVKAQFNLGFIYARGEGVTPHDEQAVYWWKMANENGNAHAKLMLGLFYNLGRGVGRSEQEAIVWYEQAAKHGDQNAMFNLAMLYYNGRGVDQNYDKAAQYLSILAKEGDAQAQNIYANLFLEGLGVKYSPETAFQWLQESATANNASAMFNLACQYRSGTGIEQNDKKAFYWYKKSADLKFAAAQNALGYMYAEGRGTKEDKDLAEEWFQKASENGLDMARNNSNALNQRGSFSLIRPQFDSDIRSDVLTSKDINLSNWLEVHQELVF